MASRHQLEAELTKLALPILAAAGLELVELALKGSGNRQVLRLSIDRAGTQGVGLEDCQRVSRELSPLPATFFPIQLPESEFRSSFGDSYLILRRTSLQD